LNVLEHLAEVKFLHDIDWDPFARRRDAMGGLPVGVVHGQHGEATCASGHSLVVGIKHGDIVGLHAIADVVQMCDFDTFGNARCTA
jgi:hypothetical protein